MKLSIISFTENGKRLSQHIEKVLYDETKLEVHLCTAKISVADWTKIQMQEKNAMLFVGACGIAVRAIAPFLTDKLHDSPVLVMDENGKYVIPILSGHMGGANEFAIYIAKKIGAEPVITTATDINKKFAVDLFAKQNSLFIVNKDGIVKVSSKVLAGHEITLSIESGHGIDENSSMPAGIRFVKYPPSIYVDVLITKYSSEYNATIILKPREYIIGIGCKKGKSTDEIDSFITKSINKLGISTTQIFALASIAQKQDEQGIIKWCQKEGILFLTYTVEQLQEVNGNFTESVFVKSKVGIGNVCERAAIKACGESGRLIAPKYAQNGMTIAIAKRKWEVTWQTEFTL